MKDFDAIKAQRDEMYNAVASAISSGNADEAVKALKDMQEYHKNELLETFAEYDKNRDERILAERGVRNLTTEETKFWNSFIDRANHDFRNESGVYTGIMEKLPKTEYESIVEELKREHPLLNAIDFTSVSAVTKWTIDASPEQRATWNVLNTAITNELFGGPFTEISMVDNKLTAFMLVSRDMLDLGPRWVASYALTMLKESISLGIEYGIIAGCGASGEPTGMTRDFLLPCDPSTGYPKKDAIKVDNFGTETYATVLSLLAQKDNGRTRKVNGVVLIVNPVDYFTKIYVSTTGITASMNYVNNIFPYPTTVIQSEFIEPGEAVMGIAKDYFFGLSSAKGGVIEQSDDVKFLEDQRAYKTKLYGNGRSKQSNGFVLLDISNVSRVIPEFTSVEAKATAYANSITCSGITLDKSFDKLNIQYNAETSAASTKVTVDAVTGATVTITANGSAVTDGNVSLAANKTTKVRVKVVLGDSEKTYIINIKRK